MHNYWLGAKEIEYYPKNDLQHLRITREDKYDTDRFNDNMWTVGKDV